MQQRKPKKHSNRYEHSTAQHKWHAPEGTVHYEQELHHSNPVLLPEALHTKGMCATKTHGHATHKAPPAWHTAHKLCYRHTASQARSKGSPKSIATDTSTQLLSTSGMRQEARYTTCRNKTTVNPALLPGDHLHTKDMCDYCKKKHQLDTPPTSRQLLRHRAQVVLQAMHGQQWHCIHDGHYLIMPTVGMPKIRTKHQQDPQPGISSHRQ
jgi:hypothetical protein